MRNFTFRLPVKWQLVVRKVGLFFLPLLITCSIANAQVTAYGFSQTTGTYTPITGGTVVGVATDANPAGTPESAPMDDFTYTGVALPFSFTFNGVAYTTININTNGWASFSTTTSTSSGVSGTTNAISPFGNDMMGIYAASGTRTVGSNIITAVSNTSTCSIGAAIQGAGIPTGSTITAFDATSITISNAATVASTATYLSWTTGEIRVETIGTAPNRIFVIQFKGMSQYSSSLSATGNNSTCNFQIHLEEGAGLASAQKVNIVYGAFFRGSTTTSRTGQTGIRGSSATTDFNNRTTTTDWAATIAGTSTTSTMTWGITILPAPGLTYTWAPPSNCSGTPAAGTTAQTTYYVCSGSTQVLTITGAALPAPGINFQWEQSADGTTGWVNVTGGTGPATTSYTTAAYAGTPVYYRMKTTCSFSGLSATTPVIMVTGPAAPATQASLITAGTLGLTTATLSWTVGSGNNRTVYINSTNSFVDPVSPNTPGTAATVWANAGQQLVYDGTASSVSITALSASTIYYVRVYEGQKCTTPTAAWYYNVSTATNNPGAFTTASPPANDECVNAVTVGVNAGSTCTTVVSGTLVGASASTGPASTCGTYDDDVWYKFVPASDIHIITLQNLAGSTSDLTFQVLDACGATTALLCSDPQSATISGLTVGNTYYLRVASWTSTVGQTSTFDVCITTPPAMTYTSSAVTQSSTASVVAGTINQQVLRIAVSVSGVTMPLSLTQLDFNTTGTTNAADIDSARVFFTGTSSSFATTTRFGTGIANPNGAFSITGSQVLTGSATTAINYFWLVYDIDCASTAANLVDAECTSINVGGPQTPTTPAPTGTRAITAPTYTAVTSQSSTAAVLQGATNAQILRVTLTGCANSPVTEINFSTTGSTNAGSDIAAARVYYTSTTTFATTTQFGSDVASPNGAFTVSGSQPLTTGTGYFWLVYDITAGATPSNVIDASCVNATTNSVVATPTTPNPTGTRTIVVPIINDEASGATALTVNSDLACGTVISGTTVSATQSADAAPTCSATGIDDDVWYTFVATGASHRISYSSVSTGTMVAALYTGAPGTLSLVTGACASTTLDATGLVSGTTYYVRAYNTATTSATQSSFNICIGTPPPPPANDACANAVNLTVSNGFCASPVLGTLISADSTTGLGGASCEALALKFDVWYKVTMPATGKVTVQTSAVNTTVTDLVLQAYSGSCGSLTAIGCDDDGNPDASPSSAHAKLGLTGRTPGEVIFFRVMPYNSSTNTGAFAICAFDTTASLAPLVASGTPNGCINVAVPVNVDSAYKYTWVSFKDASGNLIAQIYPNGNILGNTSASFYLNSGAVRQDNKGIYYLDRNVTIIPAQQPITAVTTRLYLTNAELSALATVAGATTRSQLNISKTSQDCAGSAVAADGVYIAQSTSAAYGTEHTVDFNNTAFSTFYLNKGTVALPITLVYFNGAKTNAGNFLNWKVNCTSVSVGFEIERSANGRNFTSIGALNATQARCLTPFDFADSKPLAGVNYYRIKIIDVDGKVSYTNVVAINNKKSGIELVGLQPTLVYSEAVLYIAAAKAGKLQIAVTDNVGRQIQTRTITVAEGDNKVKLNFGNLAAGVYNLSSINESTKSTIRFVKQ